MDKSPPLSNFQQRSIIFNNRGLYLKKDVAQLEDGMFSELTNIQSIVEGTLTQRYGTRRITDSTTSAGNATWGTRYASVQIIHSINKLRGAANLQYFYAGSNGAAGSTNFLWRLYYSGNSSALGAIPVPGTAMPATVVAFNCVTDSTQPYTTQRWSGVRYNAGSIGTPYMFFATPAKMLKDIGTTVTGSPGTPKFSSGQAGAGDGAISGATFTGDGTLLQRWGIIPPVVAATPYLDAIKIIPSIELTTTYPRVNTTVSTASAATSTATTNCLVYILPVNITGIVPGMQLNIGGAGGTIAIVNNVYPQNASLAFATKPGFSVYLPSVPAGGVTITSDYDSFASSTTPGVVQSYHNTVNDGSFVVGVSYSILTIGTTNWNSIGYSGTPAIGGNFVATGTSGGGSGTATQLMDASFDGTDNVKVTAGGTLDLHPYDTDDIVHISVGIKGTDMANLQVVQFLVVVGAFDGTGGLCSNYYEIDIIPNPSQDQVNNTVDPLTNLSTAAAQAQLGAQGIYNISSSNLTTSKPHILNPAPATLSEIVWTEISVPKSLFLNVGLAGSSAQYSWKNVAGFQIVGVQTATAVTPPTINIGGVYISGGYGPNAVQDSANDPLQPYSYLYTFKNLLTGQESNPSPPMITNNYITPQRQQVRVVMLSSSDPQVSNAVVVPSAGGATTQSIYVYRQGGSYTDGLFRFVGYANNVVAATTNVPQVTYFLDNQSDASILGAPTISYDNDAPVSSTLPVPFSATFASWDTGSGSFGYPGANYVNLTVTTGTTASLLLGSPLTISPNQKTTEQSAIAQVVSSSKILLYLQNDWSTAYGTPPISGAPFVTCSYVVGQPCNLALAALDSVFLAGDPNNPHVLYKSKNGRPESFPIVELDTGNAEQINVGSPSNPIINITEFNGQILCMNLEALYIVQVFLGAMQAPLETPSQRGLYSQWAWCKVENELWFLSYDGIYAWSGGAAVKKSEAIDTLFQGITTPPLVIPSANMISGNTYQIVTHGTTSFTSVGAADNNPGTIFVATGSASGTGTASTGSYAPIDLSSTIPAGSPAYQPAAKDVITMAYSKQRVYVTYLDTNGNYNRLRYDTMYDRWSVETSSYGGAISPTVGGGISAQYVEQDTGFRYASGQETESNLMLGITTVPNKTSGGPAYAQVYLDGVGTTDGWFTNGNDGNGIIYSFTQAAYTLNAPSFQKQYSDVIMELSNDNAAVYVQNFYDFSVGDTVDLFTIPIPSPLAGRRRVVYTMQNGFGKEAYAMQMRYSGLSTQPVTFYTNTFNYFSLDQIQVGRSFDWDDLGTPDDKRIYEISVWYDAKSGPHTWCLDAIVGITNTQTVYQQLQTFTLQTLSGTYTGPSWTQVTFPINDNMVPGVDATGGVANSIVKKVRFRPVLSSNTGNPFIVRNYDISYEKLPPDIVLFTMWSDLGYQYDKIARNLVLDIDTGNVACTIVLQADGAAMQTFTVTTNSNDRERVLACNSNLEGRMWRLTLTPGSGGKAQLFRAALDFIPDVNYVTYMDTYEQDGGYIGYKAIKQAWIDYMATSTVTINFITDNGAAFYTTTLPAKSTRELARFYLPAVNAGVLNKTKKFRIKMSTSGVFRLYANSTLELILFGTDQRADFSLVQTSAEKQLPTAQMIQGAWTL